MRELSPPPPVEILRPKTQSAPCVFSSPHSGRYYPAEFLALSQLDALTLRRSEDCFVDELFSVATDYGAPLIRMNYPRAYVDVNRAPYELDPKMYADPLPLYADTASQRVAGGLGTVPRIVGTGLEIYSSPLPFSEAEKRIETVYRPFHALLQKSLEETHQQFGFSLLIDCHSMPSLGAKGPLSALTLRRRDKQSGADIVLGDRFGTSCAPHISDWVEQRLSALGLRVARNTPYAGGFIARTYGTPHRDKHVLQIEIARSLYMDEQRIEKHAGFDILKAELRSFIKDLTEQSRIWAPASPSLSQAAE